jgi:hypothetical protein
MTDESTKSVPNRSGWYNDIVGALLVVVTSLCASTSLAQVDDARLEKWTIELRRGASTAGSHRQPLHGTIDIGGCYG